MRAQARRLALVAALAGALALTCSCRSAAPAASAHASERAAIEPFAIAAIAAHVAPKPSDVMAAPTWADVDGPGVMSSLRVRVSETLEAAPLAPIPLPPLWGGEDELALVPSWPTPVGARDRASADQRYAYDLVAVRRPWLATARDIERITLLRQHEYVCGNDRTGYDAWHIRLTLSAASRERIERAREAIGLVVRGLLVDDVSATPQAIVLAPAKLTEHVEDDEAVVARFARELCDVGATCRVEREIH